VPASYEEYVNQFEELIGTTGPATVYNDRVAAGVFDWIDIYESTGIPADSDPDTDLEAFSEFLLAFYPQDKSREEWWYDREEFYDNWGISAEDIDWEGYRDAIGYSLNEQ
jgi:hypothetical protein